MVKFPCKKRCNILCSTGNAKYGLENITLALEPLFSPKFWWNNVVGIPIPCLYLILFIYLNTIPSFFDQYAWNLCTTKSSDKISQVSLCGEQTKSNVDEGDILLIWLLVIPFLFILFVFVLPSPDVHIMQED